MTAPTTTTTALAIGGGRVERIAIATPWVSSGDDLADLVRDHAVPHLEPGDTLFISEKVVAVALGKAIPAERLRPGTLARRLSAAVGATPVPIPGLNVPEKMQLVIDTVGAPRALAAAAAAAVTKPFGIRGAFYRVVGEWSQDIDGMSPPYERTVIPPLAPEEAERACECVAAETGGPAAIVDINDRGGTIRAVTPGLDPEWVLEALRDNPLGQRRAGTPLGVLRRAEPPARA